MAKAGLAVSRCNDITIWGVGEPDSWVPSTFSGQGQALLYDSNYQPKAAYTSFLNALSGTTTTPPPSTPTHAPTSTPTSMPTSVPTTPTSTGGAKCSVHYAVTNQWPGGFGVSVTIANTGSSAINGWTLSWTFANGQTITQIWNASASQSGGNVNATNLSYDATIAPAGSVNFGFNRAWNGTNTSPT